MFSRYFANDKKITLEDIQDRTGFSYSQVYRIVRGENNISVSGLIAVCKALEVQPVEIFSFHVPIPNIHRQGENLIRNYNSFNNQT